MISVSYPWLPTKCKRCGKFGHGQHLCPSAVSTWNRIDKSHDTGLVQNTTRSTSRESKNRRRSRPSRSRRETANLIYMAKGPVIGTEYQIIRKARQEMIIDRPTVVMEDEQIVHEAAIGVAIIGQAEGSSAVSDLPVDCNLSRIVVDNWTEEVEKQTDAPESKSLAEDSIKTSLAPKQTVSLDHIMGFSTVHVYHEEGGSFAGPRDCSTDDSEAPFLLVNNRKSSRKATKA